MPAALHRIWWCLEDHYEAGHIYDVLVLLSAHESAAIRKRLETLQLEGQVVDFEVAELAEGVRTIDDLEDEIAILERTSNHL